MQETEQLIALYHTGFIICLFLTIIFAALSVFIFIKFKIRNVFDFITGRAQKRTIQQMEAENAQTGKLRTDTYVPGTADNLYTTPSGKIPPVIYPPTQKMATGSEPTEQVAADRTPAGSDLEGTEQTTLLRGAEGTNEVMLHEENIDHRFQDRGVSGETTLLTPEMEKMLEKQETPYGGKFEIVRSKMLIHTEEQI